MLNWSVFKNIVFAAIFAGLLSGLLLTGIQEIKVNPLILQAEVYEELAVQSKHADDAATLEHIHSAADQQHTHEQAWQPAAGNERKLYTLLANISLAIGFALLLGTAICLYGKVNAYTGLLWGLAGYMVFFLAPALGMPPQLPGAETAPLMDRQLWWLLTVVVTAAGLTILVFMRSLKFKLLGLIMLAIPHVIGTPHLEVIASAAPQQLTQAFIYATAFANVLFWLALGGLVGIFYKKST